MEPRALEQQSSQRAVNDERPLIFLVEEDEHLGQVITAYLERDGCRVLRLENLAAAASAAAVCPPARPPQLLILDLDYLDGKNEPAGLHQLASIPVMLLASTLLPEGSRRPNAAPLLQKPFTMQHLRRAVHTALSAAG